MVKIKKNYIQNTQGKLEKSFQFRKILIFKVDFLYEGLRRALDSSFGYILFRFLWARRSSKGLKKFKSVSERYSHAFDFFQIVFRTGTIHKNYSMSSFDIGNWRSFFDQPADWSSYGDRALSEIVLYIFLNHFLL